MAINAIAIRIYEDAGNVIEAHEHTGDFKEWVTSLFDCAGRLFVSNVTGNLE